MVLGTPGDDGPTHLSRRQVVGEVGAHEGAGGDPDVDVQLVEVDSLEHLVESPQGADLVDRPFQSSAR